MRKVGTFPTAAWLDCTTTAACQRAQLAGRSACLKDWSRRTLWPRGRYRSSSSAPQHLLPPNADSQLARRLACLSPADPAGCCWPMN